MPQTFGSILLHEREKLGLTLEQATAATRVRTKILASFEADDFESMPPRGYAQNMIGSYARFLGLDPQKIIDLYLDELDEFESSHSFENNPYSYYGHSARVGSVKREANDKPMSRTDPSGRIKRYSRNSNHEVSPHRRYRTYGAEEPASEPTASTVRRNRSVTADNAAPRNGRASHSNRIFSKKRSGLFSSYSGGEGGKRTRLIVIAIAIIALIVLALVLGSCVSSCSKSKTSAQSTTPTTTASSMASETGTQAETQAGTQAETDTTQGGTTAQTTPATPMTVTFSLPENTTSTMEVVVDGSPAYSATAIGPVTETYSVTRSIEMTIGSPSNVTVTKDGEPVNIDNEEGTGHVNLTVGS